MLVDRFTFIQAPRTKGGQFMPIKQWLKILWFYALSISIHISLPSSIILQNIPEIAQNPGSCERWRESSSASQCTRLTPWSPPQWWSRVRSPLLKFFWDYESLITQILFSASLRWKCLLQTGFSSDLPVQSVDRYLSSPLSFLNNFIGFPIIRCWWTTFGTKRSTSSGTSQILSLAWDARGSTAVMRRTWHLFLFLPLNHHHYISVMN